MSSNVVMRAASADPDTLDMPTSRSAREAGVDAGAWRTNLRGCGRAITALALEAQIITLLPTSMSATPSGVRP